MSGKAKTSTCRLGGWYASHEALLAHVVPYATWIAGIVVLLVGGWISKPWADAASPVVYAVKSVVVAALVLALRPWRFYGEGRVTVRDGVVGVLVGILVAFLWIFPESGFFWRTCPDAMSFYNKWLIFPLGDFPQYFAPDKFPELPATFKAAACSPENCGWFLVAMRIFGSAIVIAGVEEYFFRGFLYRWLQKSDFTAVSVRKYEAAIFWVVVLVFGLEHDRWLAGCLAGMAYGGVVLATGRLRPAIIAHLVTNWLLGIWVVHSGQYGFW